MADGPDDPAGDGPDDPAGDGPDDHAVDDTDDHAVDDTDDHAVDDTDEFEGGEGRITRTVESFEAAAHVTLPAAWAGETVEVVRVGPPAHDRTTYAVAAADEREVFAKRTADGTAVAGPDVVDALERGAANPSSFYVGLGDRAHVHEGEHEHDGEGEHDGGAVHVAVPVAALADGLLVLGGPETRAPALLGNLAWQAVAGGAGGAVISRDGATATRFARALPDDRADDLQVVGGPDGLSVNLLDPGVPPNSVAFFDAVDAVTDALSSLLVVVSPQLRDAVREFVMVATGADAPASLPELRELVRWGLVGDDADVPAWVPERSPDLLERVAAVDAEALEWFLDSLAPFLAPPARSLLADPDPDVALVDVVRSRAPLAVRLPPERYDDATWTAAGRALVHALWGAGREFVPADDPRPFVLVGDEFGPVLAAATNLDRLFARLHRDPVVAAFGVRDAGTLDDETRAHLAAHVGAHATFGAGESGDLDRFADLTGHEPDAVAALATGHFWFGGEGVAPRRLLGYHPLPARRSGDDVV